MFRGSHRFILRFNFLYELLDKENQEKKHDEYNG